MKSFRLGVRRPSVTADAAPLPSPRMAVPSMAEAGIAGIGSGEAAARSGPMPGVAIDAIYSDTPPPQRTPRPPFRLLRPSVAVPASALEPPEAGGEAPPPVSPQAAGFSHRLAGDGVSRLRGELLARALPDSLYGRRIVQLLTLPWVRAPSGLAATVLPAGTPQEQLTGYADAINALSCGAQAYADGAAGVLAVHRIEQLGRMLQRSGLSPIVPQDAPTPWAPLLVRRPSAFLLEDFLRDKTQLPYVQEPH